MADGVKQPNTNTTKIDDEQALTQNEQDTQIQQPNITEAIEPASANVIWTTRFIVIFALTLVLGLSAESLLTQGWQNHYYAGAWVPLPHVALIVGCLIATMVVTRSWWIRLGGIFAIVWAIFTSINLVLSLYTLDPASPIPAHVNTAMSSALLGAYLCFAIDSTALGKWDSWFFRIVPLIVIFTVTLAYFRENRSLIMAEDAAAAIMQVFCVLVWWLRPACWRMQPGPTFLLGLMPALLLVLALPGVGVGATNFFLSQVALFSLLLGIMRILQGELRKRV